MWTEILRYRETLRHTLRYDIHRYAEIDPHQDALAYLDRQTYTQTNRHSETHTKIHIYIAKSIQAEPWRQRGFE